MSYCDRCERWFNSHHAFDAHRRDSSRHHMCFPCDRDFNSYESLLQHLEHSYVHHFCSYCNLDFGTECQLGNHKYERHEFCDACDLWLETSDDLVEHNTENHYYCVECDRLFTSLNALQNHLNSSKHRPKNVTCPGRGCGAQFISNSALMLHLEAGTCRSGATRDSVNRFVAEHDTNHFITNPNRMITGTTQTWATEQAWNGSGYECYFCHRQYRNLTSLNQHLASPAHVQSSYHCPKLGHGCQVQFKTLSALCQHIESGSCGVMKFRVVQDTLNDLVRGANRIGYR